MVETISIRESEDKDRYYLYSNDNVVGEIIMQWYKGYIALSHIDIYREFRGQRYGKIVIDFLLNTQDAKAIVGESLKTSVKFWQSCIREFGGYTTKKGRAFANTAFVFVVGSNEELDDDLLDKLVTMCYKY